MPPTNDLKIAGIPFAVWVQVITTVGTVFGAFSVVNSQLQVATSSIQELKQDVRDLRDRGAQNERILNTIPAELKYFDRRLADFEASRAGNPK